MEARGDTPQVWVEADDLVEMGLRPGPFLTVVLATEAGIENASQQNQLRWRGMRDELAAGGTPEPALAAVDPLVPDAHQAGGTLVAIATADGLLHESHWPGLPFRELARWERLPVLAPLLDLRQSSPAYLKVVVDRHGADVTAVHQQAGERTEAVDNDLHHARKVAAGGWSQRRYQERAEGVWESNAKEVADIVARLADRVGAGLVAVAGDVRAVQLLKDSLPERLAGVVHVLDGSRATDGAPDVDADQLQAALASVSAHDDDLLIEKLLEEHGQGDRAAVGVDATVAALAQAQVQVLLLHDDPDDDRTAWFGPDPTAVSLSPGDLGDLGVADPEQGRLADVLLRSALGTGAGMRMVPATERIPGGVGGILRWA
jgi:hypothetical protein